MIRDAGRGAPAAATLLAGAVALLALLPLGFVLWVTVETGWVEVRRLVWRPRVGELLAGTLLLVATVGAIAIAGGRREGRA